MTYQDVLRMHQAKEIIIVDVRTKEEFQSGHIQGAIHCNLETLSKEAPKVLKDKNAHYFVYCQSGYRSSQAEMQLNMMGYNNVDNLGGIMSWPYDLSYEDL